MSEAPLAPPCGRCGYRHVGGRCLKPRVIAPAVSGEDRNVLYASTIETAKRGARRNNSLRAERQARKRERARRAGRNSANTRYGVERKKKK